MRVNLRAAGMFDALRRRVCSSSALAATTTSGILGNAAYVAKIVSELDRKSSEKSFRMVSEDAPG